MERARKRFHGKHGITGRICSLALVFVMLFTMVSGLPGGQLTTQAAGTDTNVTIHFMMPNSWGWTEPAVWFQGSNVVVTGDSNGGSNKPVPGWGSSDVGYSMTKGTVGAENTDYSITMKGTLSNLQFMDIQSPSTGLVPNAYDSKLTQYKEDTPTDVYYIQKGGSWAYYTDAAGSTPLPDLPETEDTFLLTGDIPGVPNWDATAEPNFVKSDSNENIYTLTVKAIPAGNYNYKVLDNSKINGWDGVWASGNDRSLVVSAPADVKFSLDKTDSTHAVTTEFSYIQDLVVATPANAQKGQDAALPATGTYYDGTGSATADVAVSYTAVSAGITVNGTTLTVPAEYTGTNAVIKAVYSGFEKEITIPVVDKLYTYTIYYYDFDAAHMSTDATDLWIWQDGGADGVAHEFSGTEQLSDGNTWLKATVTLPYYNKIRIKPRSKGAWDWEKGTISYNNADQAENKTIYITSTGIVSETLPSLVPPRDRFVLVEYDRPAGDYTGWNIFTWNSGFGSAVSIPVQEFGGKMVAKVPVMDSSADLMLSFCMRRSETGNDWAEKDGGDHYVNVPANQTVVKAKFVQDEGIVEVLPYNTGYTMDGANGMIHFYYRDDTLSVNSNLASLDGKVSVTVNGTEHAMTYDAATDRFCFDLTGVDTGDYYYYYKVDGEEKLDAFNAVTGNYNGKDCSKCTYRKFNMTISADMSQAAMDYNDNNVLTVNYHPADGQSMDGFAVTSATVDLSAMGLSSAQAINMELMALSIACKDTTTAGVKTLPVTVTDVYGNVYTANATVTVEARNKSGDFDWDEAVIYFAVTDRFFDGNAANNNAYGVNDYNTGEKGGSSYHGGDFAGLTAKLDYLKELGVNTIWITPIVENITADQHNADLDFATYGYHGYWASDFTQLNKHLGTKDEFRALLDAAHSKNMKIMVDVVLNHAGYGTEDYFNSILTDEAGNPVSMVRGDDNTVSDDDKLYPLDGLPDFVTENAAVRNQLVQWQTQWMDEFDIDYYRVDTVKHVDNTTWAAFKNSLTKVNPDFKMIGEYSGAGYANTAGELGTGTMDSLLDFDFNGWAEDFVTGNISGIERNLQKRNGIINNTATMGSFLSSHDDDTLQALLVKEKNVSEQEAYHLAKVAATLQITAKGQPVIYYGEEIGQAGENNWPYQTNRRDFDWAELARQQNDNASMYHHYKTMLGIRGDYSALFAKGSRTTVAQSDAEGYEVISRSYGGDTLYIGMNIKDTAKSVTIPVDAEPNTVLVNLYDKTPYTVSADKTVTISIPAAADGGTFVLGADKNNEYRLVIPVTDDFTEVVDTITAVPDGTGIVVVLEGTTVVPVDVFNTAAGRNVDLFFSVGDEAMWSLNGKSIVTRPTAGIDFGVTLGGSKIAADKVKEIAGDNKTLQVSLAHDGKFGFDAGLLLLVGTQYEGQYANLFYYNPETGKLEYSQTDKVEEGYVFYTFSHASDYVIVFSGSDMNPDLNKTANTTPTVSKPKTGDSTPFGATRVVLMAAAAVMAGVTVRRRVVRR